MNQLLTIDSYRKLYAHIDSMDDGEFKLWLIGVGLLNGHRNCTGCGREIGYRGPSGKNKVGAFRCRKRDCDQRDIEIGFYAGTFFEDANITPKDIFALSFSWCLNKLSYDDIERELRRDDGTTISRPTIVDWMQFFRLVACHLFIFINNPPVP